MSTEICPNCGLLYRIGEWPYCPHGIPHGGTTLSAIHTSERTVVFRNPKTGEVRFPPRADMPMHENYASQGYVREELSSAADVRRFEKTTGHIHERSWYDPGSATAERDMALPEAHMPGLDGPESSPVLQSLMSELGS